MTRFDDPLASLRTTSSFAEIDAALSRAGGPTPSLTLREQSAEMDYFVAARGMQIGADPRHTLSHVAALLAVNPARTDWVALLDAMIAMYGDLEHLLPQGPQRFYADEAVRAYLWSRAGRLPDAVALLLDVTHAQPAARYLDAWVLPALRATGLAPLGAQLAVRTLSAALQSHGIWGESSARRAAAAGAWAELALTYARGAGAQGGEWADALAMMVPGLCRKAGRFDDGLAFLRAFARPSWHAFVARGLLLRERGEVDAAWEAFAAGGGLDPDDISWMLEAGDTLFDARRWAEAQRLYQDVLSRDPGHAWALPSALYCAWRQGSDALVPDQPLAARLIELKNSGSVRAGMLLDRSTPYRGCVPRASDAMANLIASLLDQYPPGRAEPGTSVRVTLSDVEGPSNSTLLRLLWGGALDVEVQHTHVAHPDPREPVGEVVFRLWRREGERLVPALAPPSPALSTRVAAMASADLQRHRAWAAASREGASLPPSMLPELLACAVHPPPVPADVDPLAWLPRVQLVVAFVAANVATDEPWPTSARRAALTSLLLGPLDWTVTAAIVALAQSVTDEPEIVLDVHRLFARLLAARPDAGAVCWEEPLLYEWLPLPGLFPEEREALTRRLDALPR